MSADKWKEAKLRAYVNEKRTVCEVCGRAPATDAHHAIVKRDKNNKKVDNIINVQMVCHKCHMEGKADGYKNMTKAVDKAVERYGREAVIEWLKSLNKEVGEQLVYLENKNE